MVGACSSLDSANGSIHRRHYSKALQWPGDERRREPFCVSAPAVVRQRGCGTNADQTAYDLCDPAGAIAVLLEQDRANPFDLAYLVAGIGDVRPESALVDPPELVLRAAQVNFAAPAAMAAALAEQMAQRGRGRIVLIGSAAANHSLPFAASYAGSKAGLARFADALRIAVKPYGVSVTLAAPGFIDTPAARAHSANRPFGLPVEEAARRIALAAQRRAPRLVTPWPFALLQSIDRLLPGPLRDRILGALKP